MVSWFIYKYFEQRFRGFNIRSFKLGLYNYILLPILHHWNFMYSEIIYIIAHCYHFLLQILPTDDSILHAHFCPFATCDHGQDFTIPEVVLQLLRAGACGRNLQRLVLHVMKDEKAIGQLCDIIRDLECERYFRVSGLLLQVAVWFHQQDNLRQLLLRGVNPENFWQAVFLPEVVPSSSPLTNIEYSDQDDHAG